MTLNIPIGYYEAAFQAQPTGGSRPAVVTMGLHYTGSNVATDFATVATAWATGPNSEASDNWTYTEARLRDAIGNVVTIPRGNSGGVAHTPATPNVAFLCHKTTALGGRKQHGRMYMYGVSEQDVDGVGVVVGSKITALGNALTSFLTNAAAANFFWVLLHNGTTPPTPIASFAWESLAATQRRRIRK